MGSRVRFGVGMPRYDDWPRLAERVGRYEALGLDTFWVPDTFVSPEGAAQPWPECWALLAALAARTRRIRLGPLVTHAVYRNPAVLAHTALTVDLIAGGRLELGLGTGELDRDWIMTGGAPWPFAERVDRFAEVVAIVDGLLRGTVSTYEGRYYRVAGVQLAPGPLQRPRPRLLIAAGGRRMVRLAARHADAWVTYGAYPELAGRQATVADVVRLTRERAALLDETAAALGREPAAIGRVFLAGFSPGAEAPWAGADAAAAIIGRYQELGFDEFVFPEPQASEWATFERVAAAVLPGLAAP